MLNFGRLARFAAEAATPHGFEPASLIRDAERNRESRAGIRAALRPLSSRCAESCSRTPRGRARRRRASRRRTPRRRAPRYAAKLHVHAGKIRVVCWESLGKLGKRDRSAFPAPITISRIPLNFKIIVHRTTCARVRARKSFVAVRECLRIQAGLEPPPRE